MSKRFQITLPDIIAAQLTVAAKDQGRSPANLAAFLIEVGLNSYKPQTPKLKNEILEFSQVFVGRDLKELSEQALIPLEKLEAVADGEYPDTDTLIGLGRVLAGWDTESLLKLRDRTFNNQAKRKQGNGSNK
ncbi:hypothetical protein [Okeania sp. SIO2B3]|uniref:ribbon-helix-helix domain-containing protein n=1 Tax=Okeania sp. SIO2B3 TaxID=2607784 RepID=UPI0013BED154|nr:hypothetical protein [Okeania sp. SIO2B3]NET46323.1 hypothetical protein [Okeania sp. SIO2B3]